MSRRSDRRRSEAWADIQPAVLSAEDEAVVSAQAERKAALAARPDLRGEPVPASVNLAVWMRSGFFECKKCLKHWQPDEVAPGGEQEPLGAVAGVAMGCPFCEASKWAVKWVPPAF